MKFALDIYFYFLVLVPPLFVVEFLHRVVDTFEDYFSECTESIIKEHYVVVYEVNHIVTFVIFYQ